MDLFGQLQEGLTQLHKNFLKGLDEAKSGKDLEDIRVKFFGKKSELSTAMKAMGQLSNDERPKFGQFVNALRAQMDESLKAKLESISEVEEQAKLKAGAIDVTLPVRSIGRGAKHPIQQTIDLISDIFMGMGYSIQEGPEVEYVKYNFELLRIPEGHPARDEKDTFYINPEVILRTQTSPVQVRTMETTRPPFKMICPGRVYRTDKPDATHSPIFHQIEGMVVDKGVAMSDLVGTLQLFAVELFGADTKIRLRPHHFPFTEPSCEVDVTCWRCGGSGCGTCKNEGFVEILGAGMVHPWVLEQSGIDSSVYSGFAFGLGVERTAMARFDIDDIRNLYENNLSFLEQFK